MFTCWQIQLVIIENYPEVQFASRYSKLALNICELFWCKGCFLITIFTYYSKLLP